MAFDGMASALVGAALAAALTIYRRSLVGRA